MKNAKNITIAQIKALWNDCNEVGVRGFFLCSYIDNGFKLLEDDSFDGARRRWIEWRFLESELHNKLRINLDERVDMYKELRELQDIDLWEEEGLTQEQSARMSELQEQIKATKLSDLRIKAIIVKHFE